MNQQQTKRGAKYPPIVTVLFHMHVFTLPLKNYKGDSLSVAHLKSSKSSRCSFLDLGLSILDKVFCILSRDLVPLKILNFHVQ